MNACILLFQIDINKVTLSQALAILQGKTISVPISRQTMEISFYEISAVIDKDPKFQEELIAALSAKGINQVFICSCTAYVNS